MEATAAMEDAAGFSSFFVDYKVPSLKRSLSDSSENLDHRMYATPSESASTSSASNNSLSATVLTPAQATRTLTLKRKLFDNNQEALKAAISAITIDERQDLLDIEHFAAFFKEQRMKYGCTQNDIGQSLGKKYGTEFSQTTISRFEALNLSFKNMCKLRPLLKEWLVEVENALGHGITMSEFLKRAQPQTQAPQKTSKSRKNAQIRHRKKRTFIDEFQSVKLIEAYNRDSRPSQPHLKELSDKLNLDKDVVRIWFSNHRQKIRKLEDERITLELQFGTSASPI